jgi:hypothetical protein
MHLQCWEAKENSQSEALSSKALEARIKGLLSDLTSRVTIESN